MSFRKTKIPIFISGPYQWWRLATFVMFGAMLGSIMFSAIFVYNYTFRTLEDAHTIVLLNTESAATTVNLENFNKSMDLLNTKASTSTISSNLRNIFIFPPAVATSTYASSTVQ